MLSIEEEECRVCRGEAERYRRLYSPCKCNGSIRYVHSDCLNEWLTISQRDTCDLCGYTFQFRQVYASDYTPYLSIYEFTTLAISLLRQKVFNSIRMGLILIAWFIITPLYTSSFYRTWYQQLEEDSPSISSALEGIMERMQNWSLVLDDIFSGLILMLLVIFTTLYLVCINEDVQNETQRLHDIELNQIDMRWNDEDHAEPEVEFDNVVVRNDPQPPQRLRLQQDMNAQFMEHVNQPQNIARIPVHQPEDLDEDDDWFVEGMGLYGPISIAVRNMSLYHSFATAFLFVFSFFPHILGRSFVKLNLIKTENAMDVMSIFYNAAFDTRERGETFQLSNFVTCMAGYCFLSTILLLWYLTAGFVGRILPGTWIMTYLGAVTKLTVLLTLKIFALPFVVGFSVNIATLKLFNATMIDRYSFIAHNLLGGFFIHWVLGMGFIHIVSVCVLQLREVFHPHVLTWILPPHDPHQYKAKHILTRGWLSHFQYLSLAASKYLVFVPLLLYLPLVLLETMLPSLPTLKFEFHYYSALFQVPIELALVHVVVQDTLDRFAHDLGHLQTIWMTWMCKHLDLTKFLMPRVPGFDGTELILRIPHLIFHPHDDVPHDYNQFVYGERRAEWPARNSKETRYEYNLLERETPTYLVIRILALVCCWWFTLVLFLSSITLGPLFLGRTATAIFSLHFDLQHDTLNFGAGVMLFYAIIFSFDAYRALSFPNDQVHPELKVRGFRVENASTWNFFKLFLTHFLLFPLMTGILLSLLFPSGEWPGLMEIITCGFIFVHVPIALATSITWDEKTVLNDAVVTFGRLQLHIQAFIEGLDSNVEIRGKCFDFHRYERTVSYPLGILLSHSLVGSILCSNAYIYLLAHRTNLTTTQVLRIAVTTQVIGLGIAAFIGHIKRWIIHLHDTIRDERYLIGKELIDMLYPKLD